MPKPTMSRAIPYLAMSPAYFAGIVGYLGSLVWIIYISFTSSKAFPDYELRGLVQYRRLFQTARWFVSMENIVIVGVAVMAVTMVVGILIAIALDQKIIGEGLFRTIFLYPYAMPLVVTGIAWQWLLNPDHGLGSVLNSLGLTSGSLNILNRPDRALFAIVIACVWQGAGMTVVIVLAALRGVDKDLWHAGRVDGIPTWRMYVSVVLPLITPALYTAAFLLFLGIIALYELVLALTGGGPGISTNVPTMFIMDYLFQRANIGLAAAACVIVLVAVSVGGLLYVAVERRRQA